MPVPSAPKFRKVIYSGRCMCGHSFEDHHTSMVLNQEAYKVMGPVAPGECEFYGCNENGGLDSEGNPHCDYYVDEEETYEEYRARWVRMGNTRKDVTSEYQIPEAD